MKPLIITMKTRWDAVRDRVRRGTPRERVLLAALGLVGVLIALSVGMRLLRTAVSAWRACESRTIKADAVLAAAPLVERELAEKTGRLTVRRLTATELLATVEMIAREGGLAADAGTPRSEKAGRLLLHRVRLTLQAPGVRELMDFDDRLRRRGDGISVERVLLETRNTGGELSATYELIACQPSE